MSVKQELISDNAGSAPSIISSTARIDLIKERSIVLNLGAMIVSHDAAMYGSTLHRLKACHPNSKEMRRPLRIYP